MKILISLVAVMAFALTFGVVNGEAAEVALDNAITYSDLGLAADCWSVRGMAAGGAVPSFAPPMENAITYFELAVPGSYPTGLCAGTSHLIEAPSAWVSNGITAFEE